MVTNPTTKETHRKGANKRDKKGESLGKFYGRNTPKIDFQCEEKVSLLPQLNTSGTFATI